MLRRQAGSMPRKRSGNGLQYSGLTSNQDKECRQKLSSEPLEQRRTSGGTHQACFLCASQGSNVGTSDVAFTSIGIRVQRPPSPPRHAAQGIYVGDGSTAPASATPIQLCGSQSAQAAVSLEYDRD